METSPESTAKRAVINLVEAYFEGLHFADIAKLKTLFSPDCVLKAPGIRRDLESWFLLVKSRPVPQEKGDPFAYKILAIEIVGEQALVKVYCPLLGDHFIDYLGLLYEKNQWQIVNKMYANMEGDNLCHM